MTLQLAAFLALVATAQSGTDYPHRDWGKTITLDMSLSDATTCIAREMDRKGTVLVLPVDGGNDIDFSVDVAWGKKMEPWQRFKLRSEGGATVLRIFYRHPFKPKMIDKDVDRLQRACLKARPIETVAN